MSSRDRPWNRARTNEEFLEELYSVRDDIESLDDYKTRTTTMRFRCRHCNSIFTATPVTILKGRKCDNCRPRKIKEDLTGQKFGRLIVLGIDEERKDYKKLFWKCQCDCGNVISVTTTHLKNGHSTSCGCKRVENFIKTIKKFNDYDLNGEFGIGYTTNTNKEFYFDKEDFDKIKNYTWRENSCGYIVTSDFSDSIYMHRFIMQDREMIDNKEIDHINLNKNDNRKINLRTCTHQQNNCNKKESKYNTSGHRGVQWEKRYNKWRARISVNGKDIHLGLFEDYDNAVAARTAAEEKYYKEFRYKGEN